MDKNALKQEADRWMHDRREAMVDLLCELVACDTTNPPGNEEKAAPVVRSFLQSRGIPWVEHSAEPGRPNILAEIGSGRSPRLLVAGHTDVVPAGPGWTGDPFQPRRQGGRIVGRGSTDNKGSFPGLLETAAFLKLHEKQMKGTLVLGAVADEERGSSKGLKYLLAENLVRADFGIIPDNSGGLVDIAVGEKGLLEIDVRAHGKAAHASRPQNGVSAIWAMQEFLARVKTYRLPGKAHPLFTPATLNVGTIRGGHASNIVPEYCEACLNIRYLPDDQYPPKVGGGVDAASPSATALQILADLRGLAEAAQTAVPGSRLELEITEDQPAWVLDGNPPWLESIKTNTRRATGKEPEPGGLAGTTVAKLCYFAGIPSVNFGPGDHDAPHVADEWVEVGQVVDFGKILAGVCVDLLF